MEEIRTLLIEVEYRINAGIPLVSLLKLRQKLLKRLLKAQLLAFDRNTNT